MNGASPLVLRPATQVYATWVRRPDPVTVLFVTVLVGAPVVAAVARWILTGDGADLLLLLGLVVLGVALGLGGALVSMRTTSVTVTGSSIEHRSWFIRHIVLPRDGLRGILCDYRPPVSQKGSALLVLQSIDGQGPRIRLNGAFWAAADLETIAEAAGVPREDRELRAHAVEERLPGILRFQERRPVIFLALFPIAILVVAVVGGSLFVAFAGENEATAFPAATERQQDDLVREVSGAVDAAWRDRFPVRVSGCDAVENGLSRRVERTADAQLTGDEVEEAARTVETVARDNGLEDVETAVTAAAFEVHAGDGTSSFDGGAILDVEYADGVLTLESTTSCVTP